MRVKMKAGHGMTGPLMTGCGIQIFWRDSFNLTAGCRIKKRKINVYRRNANCDPNQARSR